MTEDRREAAKGRMLDTAARVWRSFKKSHRTPDHQSWVAQIVTAECKNDIFTTTGQKKISTRWVSRNKKEIELRVAQLVSEASNA